MKISVIVPVFNAEKYLKKCVDSVISQTHTDWEMILVDDGSNDKSGDIADSYAVKDTRIRVFHQENAGPGMARNHGIDKATGDFLVFLDSDDYIEREYFLLLSNCIKEQGAEAVFIDVIQEKPDGEIIRYEKMSRFKEKSKKDMIGCQMTGYMPWGGVRKAVSRKLVTENHLRYSADTVGEEAIFSFEVLRNARKVSFIENGLYHYVNHPGSQSKNPNGTWEVTLAKMKQHLEEKGIEQEYKVQVASFAFVVMILWLLRYAKKNSIVATWKSFCKKRKAYINEYGWQLNPGYVRKEVRLLLPFVRMHLLLPIVVAAEWSKR